MKKRFAATLLIAVLFTSLCSCSRQKVQFSYFDGNFSPFFTRRVEELSVVALTQESLLVKSSSSEDESSEPVYDAYTQGLGIADIDIDYSGDKSVCTVRIGDDVYFSDGTKMTSKDVAFSMYVYAQADYDGWSKLRESALDGLTAYRYGTTEAEKLDFATAQLEAELANPSERTKELISSRIIYPVLRSEYTWVTHLYGDEKYKGTDVEQHMQKYSDPRALFAFYYALDHEYDALSAPDAETVIKDIAQQYGADYKTLGLVYESDFTQMAHDCARQALIEKALDDMDAERKVTSIRGIEIIDDKALKVTINSVEPEQIENVLGIYVAPFHYYGGGCTFDGQGFVIDLESVDEKSSQPLGAGKYVFKSYKAGKGVSFARNDKYFRDIPLVKSLYFAETGNSNTPVDHGYLVIPENRMYVERQDEQQ